MKFYQKIRKLRIMNFWKKYANRRLFLKQRFNQYKEIKRNKFIINLWRGWKKRTKNNSYNRKLRKLAILVHKTQIFKKVLSFLRKKAKLSKFFQQYVSKKNLLKINNYFSIWYQQKKGIDIILYCYKKRNQRNMKKCLRKLRFYCTRKKIHQIIILKSIRKKLIKTLRCCFEIWKVFKQVYIQKEIVDETIAVHYGIQLKRRIFEKLRKFICKLKTLKNKMLAYKVRIKKKNTIKYWNIIMNMTEKDRKQVKWLQEIIKKKNRAFIQKYFKSWKIYNIKTHRKRESELIIKINHDMNIKRTIYEKWKIFAQRSKIVETYIRNENDKKSYFLMNLALFGWSHIAKKKIFLANTFTEYEMHKENNLLRNCFKKWIDTFYEQENESIINPFIHR